MRRIQIGADKYIMKGELIDVLNVIASRFNTCYNLTAHKYPFPWGHLDPVNKTFDGSLGVLERNEQDFAITPFWANSERYRHFIFSCFIATVTISVLMGFPKVKPNYAGFVTIFDYRNWVAILCTFLVAFGVMTFFNVMEKFFFQRNGKRLGLKDFVDALGEGFVILFAMFIGQGTTMKRSNHSSKNLFLSTWLFSTLFLSFFYKNTLLSVLVFPKVSLPFRNIYEMVEQDEVKWVLLKGNAWYTAYKSAEPNSTFGKIFSKSIGAVTEYETPEQLRKIREGKLVLLYQERLIYKRIHEVMSKQDVCHYTIMKEKFWSSPTFFIFRRGFNPKIINMVNKLMMNLFEFGIDTYSPKRFLSPKVFRCISEAGKRRSQLRKLQIEDYLGIFGVLLVGWVLATMVFVIEILVNKFGKRRNRKVGENRNIN